MSTRVHAHAFRRKGHSRPAARLSHVDSYYAASAHVAPSRPPLAGRASTQVCVIGAGFSGIATALELAERGHQVIVLEAALVGWGASGRNGGQIVNGYSRDLDVIERHYGAAAASALGAMAYEGGDIIRERVQRYGLDCDLRAGNVFAAFNRHQMRELEAHVERFSRHAPTDFEWLDGQGICRHVTTDIYVGGLLDRRGGHVHPLNLVLGEAAALERLGGTIHEHSAVVRVEMGTRPVVYTQNGEVHADSVVVCGNAYLDNAVPALRNKIMPVSTQVMATEPLGEETAARLMPAGTCVEDCNYMLDYYRFSADNRLLFGGGTIYGGTTPDDIVAKLRPHLTRTFPELANVRIDHAWSGNFALTLTRIPQLGQLAEHVYFAHGYSGHGVTTTHLAGRLITEAMCGQRDRFDAFARMHSHAFPGGRLLRAPLSMLGSWYYRGREKLGL